MRYEYRCRDHGTFERTEPMLNEHKATCPDCGAAAVRLYSPTRWYYDNPKPLFFKDGGYEER